MRVNTTISIDDKIKDEAIKILKIKMFLILNGIRYPSITGLTEAQLKQAIEESQ